MTINFTLNVILLSIGITVGLISAFSLVVIRANREANRYLAALVLICVGALLHNFLIASGIYDQKPHLYFLPVILPFGIGPLLYLFINRLIFLQYLNRSKIFLHLLPLTLQFLFYFFCFLQTPDAKYEIYSRYYESLVKPLQILGTYISVGIYVFLSFEEINHFKKHLNNFYSNSEKIALEWLKKLLYLFMFYYLVSILFVVVSYLFQISENYFPSDLIRCAIIFTIALYAVKQTAFTGIQRNIQSVTENAFPFEGIVIENKEREKVKHVVSDKAVEISKELLRNIIETVETQQLYLNEELTIADLARQLGYSTKTISNTINKGLQKSFSLFINEYRVNLFKEKKLSGKYEQYSILGLAYECGFNSKSTFNRIFKEITGGSPKDQKSIEEVVPNPEI